MPAISSITVNDRASTPVAHVFVPDGEKNSGSGVFQFREDTGTLIGDRKITIGTSTTADKRKVKLLFVNPVVVTETINGVARPKKERSSLVSFEFVFDTTSTLQERKDAVGMAYNALAASQTMIDAVLVNNQDLY